MGRKARRKETRKKLARQHREVSEKHLYEQAEGLSQKHFARQRITKGKGNGKQQKKEKRNSRRTTNRRRRRTRGAIKKDHKIGRSALFTKHPRNKYRRNRKTREQKK